MTSPHDDARKPDEKMREGHKKSGWANGQRPIKGETDVWLTPLSIIHRLGTFDLDPCGYPGHQTAKKLICLPDDGNDCDWEGRVWLNPPYSDVENWLRHFIWHGDGVALVMARTDTRWFQKYARSADGIFFPKGRIKFMRQDGTYRGNAGAPSCFWWMGTKPDFTSWEGFYRG